MIEGEQEEMVLPSASTPESLLVVLSLPLGRGFKISK